MVQHHTGALLMAQAAPQPPAPAQRRRRASQGQGAWNRGELQGANVAQALAGAGIAQHIDADHTAINGAKQLVGPIGIGDLVNQGASGVGVGAIR